MRPLTAATRELGVQTHGDRAAVRNAAFFLSFGVILGAFGPILGCFGLFWAPTGLMGPIFDHF